MANEPNVGFFNLKADGDSAIVRILHRSTKTIEKANLHTIKIGEHNRSVGCVGEGCPCCANNVRVFERMFVHLFDYTDGVEKMWSRTTTILPQLEELEAAWGDLSNIVLKITRNGNEFPKYTLMVLPGNSYAPVDASRIDKNLGYRCYMHRDAKELEEFFRTGVMPAHESKPFVSKEEYFKNKSASSTPTAKTTPVSAPTAPSPKPTANVVDDDPFLDPFAPATPRRV